MTILANAKHEAVALAFLTDPERVGWRAYQSVYPKSSRHGAETQWSRLLKNVEFSARIAELAAEAAKGAVMTAQEVLETLTRIARANMQDYVGADDVILPVQSLTRDQAAAIGERTVEHYTEGRGEDAREVRRVKFKLADRLRALELLGKHHELFTERHKHEFDTNIADRLAAVWARINGEAARSGVDGRANDNVRPARKQHESVLGPHALANARPPNARPDEVHPIAMRGPGVMLGPR
jgi:phage terminase small subunit